MTHLTIVETSPLVWPVGWRRENGLQTSRFSTTFAAARSKLRQELDLLGASEAVLSTNRILNRDGRPAARQPRRLDDPGVVLYFVVGGEERCFPCDRWLRIEDNLHAIELSVAAIRGLERWGSGQLVEAAFRGFAALPERAGQPVPGWWLVLGLEPDATVGDIRAAKIYLSRKLHPDAGGDPVAFANMIDAVNAGLRARGVA